MKRKVRVILRFIPVLGLISATCGILAFSQLPATAAGSKNWSLNRVAKDITSVVAAGVGASISSAVYLPSTVFMGPTIASGVAGSAGFAAGGGTKIAGDYLVDNPKNSIRTVGATVIGGDISSLPANLKAMAKNIASQISNRLTGKKKSP